MPWSLKLTALPANLNWTSQSVQTHTHLHQRILPNIPSLPPFVISDTRWSSRSSNRTGSLYCLSASSTCVVVGHFCWSKCAFSRAIMTCNFLVVFIMTYPQLWAPFTSATWKQQHWQVTSMSNGSWTPRSYAPSKIQHSNSNGQLRNGLVAPGNQVFLEDKPMLWESKLITLKSYFVTQSSWIQPYLLQGNSPIWYYHKLHVLNL